MVVTIDHVCVCPSFLSICSFVYLFLLCGGGISGQWFLGSGPVAQLFTMLGVEQWAGIIVPMSYHCLTLSGLFCSVSQMYTLYSVCVFSTYTSCRVIECHLHDNCTKSVGIWEVLGVFQTDSIVGSL